jgi:hypothetical protein
VSVDLNCCIDFESVHLSHRTNTNATLSITHSFLHQIVSLSFPQVFLASQE